jgi:hypothetical protein
VAGFERGVLPIGDWSIAMILSNASVPSILSKFLALVYAPFSSFASFLYKISLISEDFPEPELTLVSRPLAGRCGLR